MMSTTSDLPEMHKLPIRVRIEHILQEEAESGVPEGRNLWPRIREGGRSVPAQHSNVGAREQGSNGLIRHTKDTMHPRSAQRKGLRGLSWGESHAPGASVATIKPGLLRLTAFVMASLLLVAVVLYFTGRAGTVSASVLLQKAADASTFVPVGKVRHIVIRQTDSVTGETGGWTDEVWLANGQKRLMMWKPAMVTPSGTPMPWDGAQLINDDGIWQFPADGDGKTVQKMPEGNTFFLDQVLPNRQAIDQMLASPNTRIAGSDTLDGHSVVVIEGHVGSFVSNTPRDLAEGKAQGYQTAQHDYKLWVDNQTYQILKEQHIITWDVQGPTGQHQIINTKRITLDELLDEESVRADMFKLPAGVKIIDNTVPVAGTPAPAPTRHTGWYDFSPTDGSFTVLMPKTPDYSTTNMPNGQTTEMYGVKQGPIAYVLKYADYPHALIAKTGADKWLDNERDYIVAGVQGKLLSESKISLDGYPGRELRVLADDGKYRICRIYLVGDRFYNVYVVMPDEGSLTPEIERYLDSLKLLK
ncbi:MAG: hypothetical protein ABI670_17780 [Chloroflexota bacterium]